MRTEATALERNVAGRLRTMRWARAMAWGILSSFGFIGTLTLLVWPIGQLQQAGVSHAASLGLWALAWVAASGLLVLPAARVTLGAWPDVRAVAWRILLLGALVSAAHVWVLADWAIGRYGYSDPDFIGPTFGLFAVVAGAAVAGFGVQVAPRWAAWLPLLALLGGGALAVSIFASNIPGLADGLGRDSGPLAAVTVAAGLYVGAVAGLSLARLRRP